MCVLENLNAEKKNAFNKIAGFLPLAIIWRLHLVKNSSWRQLFHRIPSILWIHVTDPMNIGTKKYDAEKYFWTQWQGFVPSLFPKTATSK